MSKLEILTHTQHDYIIDLFFLLYTTLFLNVSDRGKIQTDL